MANLYFPNLKLFRKIKIKKTAKLIPAPPFKKKN